ncbi:MAG: hypothetical protein JO013_06585 [Alphaproteobacteria bacterium]|nr:hypothetical protein [Alphaproteobacteria bacterium]
MRKPILLALAALCLTPAAARAAPTASAELPAKLQWQIKASGRGDGKVELNLSYRTAHSTSMWGRAIDLADLQGLDRAALDGTGNAPVRFRIVRDAGTFHCEGAAWRGNGTGECRFIASAAFAAELGRRGYGTPDEFQLFQLAMADIGRLYLEELARLGYAPPALAELVQAGNHGIHLAYLREMGGLSYRVGALPALVRMHDHGVGPDYVRGIVASGLTDLPPDTLVRMRDHGVSPAYVGALRRLGYGGLGVDRLIALRDHGVGADYVAALSANGLAGLSLEDIVRLRDHGVSADFVSGLRSAGYSFGPDELVRLHDHGVTADFARRAGARLSADELIRLRLGG